MREWRDKQVVSHLAFLPALPIALFCRQPPFLEPLVFVVPLLVLSTLYHRHHEPAGTLLSRTELFAAFSLYFYGCVQLYHSPSRISLALSSICCAGTTLVYVLTNPLVRKLDWDTWHYIGMHLVPGAWACVVALCNLPVFTCRGCI